MANTAQPEYSASRRTAYNTNRCITTANLKESSPPASANSSPMANSVQATLRSLTRDISHKSSSRRHINSAKLVFRVCILFLLSSPFLPPSQSRFDWRTKTSCRDLCPYIFPHPSHRTSTPFQLNISLLIHSPDRSSPPAATALTRFAIHRKTLQHAGSRTRTTVALPKLQMCRRKIERCWRDIGSRSAGKSTVSSSVFYF